MNTPSRAQVQAAQPVLRALALQRQEEARLSGAREVVQRQVAALGGTPGVQREVRAPVPARPVTPSDWVTVMRHRAEGVDGLRLDARAFGEFQALQRQVAQSLSQGFRSDRGEPAARYATYGEHLATLQRHALSAPVSRVVLGMIPPAERLPLQRATDEALHRMQVQEQAALNVDTHAGLQRQMAELDAEATRPVLQRIQARRGAGNPLPEAIQRHLEQGLNHDLSRVRIHDDAEADKLAKGVNALAFTTGTDIFFQSGRFDPNTRSGLELLAHEVTHTVQQSQGRVGHGIDPDAGLESEARNMGARLAQQGPVTVRPTPLRAVPRSMLATGGRFTAVQRQRDQAQDDPEDQHLHPVIAGNAGARGREAFVQSQKEATRQGTRYLAREHRATDYRSPLIRSGGGAQYGLPDLMYGGNTVEGRYNGDFHMLYGSPDVHSNLREIAEYAPSRQARKWKRAPRAFEAQIMAGRNRGEYKFKAKPMRLAGAPGGIILATDQVDGKPVDHLRRARIRRSALTAPSGGAGNHNWTKLIHRMLGEHMYTHPQILGREAYKAKAGAILVPSAIGKGANQVNILPEHTHPKQLKLLEAGYVSKDDRIYRGFDRAKVRPMKHSTVRTFNPNYQFENKGQTQRSGGTRYGAAGAGIMSIVDGVRRGDLDARDVAVQTALGAVSNTRVVHRLAQHPLRTARVMKRALPRQFRATRSVVERSKAYRSARRLIQSPGRMAPVLHRAFVRPIGNAVNQLKKGASAQYVALKRRGLRASLRTLAQRTTTGMGRIRRLARAASGGVRSNLAQTFRKIPGHLKGISVKGALNNARLALPRSTADLKGLFAKGMGGAGRTALRTVRGNAVIDGVISAGLSLKDNWKGLTKGRGQRRNQAVANVAVDTGVGIASGMAGMAAGAAIGSVIPVAGTAVGAVVGFGAGMIGSWLAHSTLTKTGAAAWAKRQLTGGLNHLTHWASGKNGAVARARQGLARSTAQVTRKGAQLARAVTQRVHGAIHKLASVRNAALHNSKSALAVLRGEKKISVPSLVTGASAGMVTLGRQVLGRKGQQVAQQLIHQAAGVGRVAAKAKSALSNLGSQLTSRLSGAVRSLAQSKKKGGLFAWL